MNGFLLLLLTIKRNDYQNDGDFHLESVQKDDLVLSQLPNGVYPERVGRAVPTRIRGRIDHVTFGAQDVLLRCRDLPRRPKNIDGLEKGKFL